MGNSAASHLALAEVLKHEDFMSAFSSLSDIISYRLIASNKLFKVFECLHCTHGPVLVKLFFLPEKTTSTGQEPRMSDDVMTRVKQIRIEIFKAKWKFSLPAHPNVLSYQDCRLTDQCVVLLRPFCATNLAERVLTRPFLTDSQICWTIFQLVLALCQIHGMGQPHGDIRPENVLLSSTGHLFLSDLAAQKPVFLPEADPADYSLFFETESRRCYLAPERFLAHGMTPSRRRAAAAKGSTGGQEQQLQSGAGDGGMPSDSRETAAASPQPQQQSLSVSVATVEAAPVSSPPQSRSSPLPPVPPSQDLPPTPLGASSASSHHMTVPDGKFACTLKERCGMDMFAVGCVMAELCLHGGAPLMGLPELLQYRSGAFSLNPQLKRVREGGGVEGGVSSRRSSHLADVLEKLLSLEPSERPSAFELLEKIRKTDAAPPAFFSCLFPLSCLLLHPSFQSPDAALVLIRAHLPLLIAQTLCNNRSEQKDAKEGKAKALRRQILRAVEGEVRDAVRDIDSVSLKQALLPLPNPGLPPSAPDIPPPPTAAYAEDSHGAAVSLSGGREGETLLSRPPLLPSISSEECGSAFTEALVAAWKEAWGALVEGGRVPNGEAHGESTVTVEGEGQTSGSGEGGLEPERPEGSGGDGDKEARVIAILDERVRTAFELLFLPAVDAGRGEGEGAGDAGVAEGGEEEEGQKSLTELVKTAATKLPGSVNPDALAIIASILGGLVPRATVPRVRTAGVEMLTLVGAYGSRETLTELVIPQSVSLLGHAVDGQEGGHERGGVQVASVRSAAVRGLCSSLELLAAGGRWGYGLWSGTESDEEEEGGVHQASAELFSEYALTALLPLAHDSEDSVRLALSSCLSGVAKAGARLFELAQREVCRRGAPTGGAGGGRGARKRGGAEEREGGKGATQSAEGVSVAASGGGARKGGESQVSVPGGEREGGSVQQQQPPGSPSNKPQRAAPVAIASSSSLGGGGGGPAGAVGGAGGGEPQEGRGGKVEEGANHQALLDARMRNLKDSLRSIIQTILLATDAATDVKVALLPQAAELAEFFGRSDFVTEVMPFLIMLANESGASARASLIWHLSSEEVVRHISKVGVQIFVWPCVETALQDPDDLVIQSSVAALASLTRLKLIGTEEQRRAAVRTSALLQHPNSNIREGVRRLMQTMMETDPATFQAFVAPRLAEAAGLRLLGPRQSSRLLGLSLAPVPSAVSAQNPPAGPSQEQPDPKNRRALRRRIGDETEQRFPAWEEVCLFKEAELTQEIRRRVASKSLPPGLRQMERSEFSSVPEGSGLLAGAFSTSPPATKDAGASAPSGDTSGPSTSVMPGSSDRLLFRSHQVPWRSPVMLGLSQEPSLQTRPLEGFSPTAAAATAARGVLRSPTNGDGGTRRTVPSILSGRNPWGPSSVGGADVQRLPRWTVGGPAGSLFGPMQLPPGLSAPVAGEYLGASDREGWTRNSAATATLREGEWVLGGKMRSGWRGQGRRRLLAEQLSGVIQNIPLAAAAELEAATSISVPDREGFGVPRGAEGGGAGQPFPFPFTTVDSPDGSPKGSAGVNRQFSISAMHSSNTPLGSRPPREISEGTLADGNFESWGLYGSRSHGLGHSSLPSGMRRERSTRHSPSQYGGQDLTTDWRVQTLKLPKGVTPLGNLNRLDGQAFSAYQSRHPADLLQNASTLLVAPLSKLSQVLATQAASQSTRMKQAAKSRLGGAASPITPIDPQQQLSERFPSPTGSDDPRGAAARSPTIAAVGTDIGGPSSPISPDAQLPSEMAGAGAGGRGTTSYSSLLSSLTEVAASAGPNALSAVVARLTGSAAPVQGDRLGGPSDSLLAPSGSGAAGEAGGSSELFATLEGRQWLLSRTLQADLTALSIASEYAGPKDQVAASADSKDKRQQQQEEEGEKEKPLPSSPQAVAQSPPPPSNAPSAIKDAARAPPPPSDRIASAVELVVVCSAMAYESTKVGIGLSPFSSVAPDWRPQGLLVAALPQEGPGPAAMGGAWGGDVSHLDTVGDGRFLLVGGNGGSSGVQPSGGMGRGAGTGRHTGGAMGSSRTGSVHVWSCASIERDVKIAPSRVWTLPEGAALTSMKALHDCKAVATGADDGSVRIHRVDTMKPQHVMTLPPSSHRKGDTTGGLAESGGGPNQPSPVVGLDHFDSDFESLIVGARLDLSTFGWDFRCRKGAWETSLPPSFGSISGLCLDPRGSRWMIVSTLHGCLVLYDLRYMTPVKAWTVGTGARGPSALPGSALQQPNEEGGDGGVQAPLLHTPSPIWSITPCTSMHAGVFASLRGVRQRRSDDPSASQVAAIDVLNGRAVALMVGQPPGTSSGSGWGGDGLSGMGAPGGLDESGEASSRSGAMQNIQPPPQLPTLKEISLPAPRSSLSVDVRGPSGSLSSPQISVDPLNPGNVSSRWARFALSGSPGVFPGKGLWNFSGFPSLNSLQRDVGACCHGNAGTVHAMWAQPRGLQSFLLTAGSDRAVRFWDLRNFEGSYVVTSESAALPRSGWTRKGWRPQRQSADAPGGAGGGGGTTDGVGSAFDPAGQDCGANVGYNVTPVPWTVAEAAEGNLGFIAGIVVQEEWSPGWAGGSPAAARYGAGRQGTRERARSSLHSEADGEGGRSRRRAGRESVGGEDDGFPGGGVESVATLEGVMAEAGGPDSEAGAFPPGPALAEVNHRDAIVALTVVSLQTPMIATGGRDGIVKLWK
uniref:non-specific serine/threonine protein kinase n=1 Tax=Chromera velia CCMP2878 TaxID=1169474 RepID=A0A0G4IDN7_9ALVE|eukprot:Cvel_13343.t1-p1 / transcript=Cvel_13343.t1 / gene=Cvel_13343 / organism=Chromera_velia_CCMP2878 / gene_product=Phosphoinositide 3-kinase regulatory subunit 4, putative / transcript_product=Phosphoinositide 3-kinase regulatory subunit 4, putative / location=Cvel_scaffold906:28666-38849(+) / protein_length=2702 / sequence_SO=supercontig / SO=protein_coding / is_pseudo=false